MARGELGAYDELFSYACPKFVTPTTEVVAASAGTGGSSAGQAAYRAQLAAFLSEVKACSTLPTLKQYLLLYSSIEIGRLAALMEEEEGVLRTQLTCLKAKAWQKKWVGGADATTGVYQRWAEGAGWQGGVLAQQVVVARGTVVNVTQHSPSTHHPLSTACRLSLQQTLHLATTNPLLAQLAHAAHRTLTFTLTWTPPAGARW